MRRFVTLIGAAVICCAAFGYQSTVNGVKWYYSINAKGEAVITYNGVSAGDVDNEYSGDLVVPSVVDGHSVVSIGRSAMNGCSMVRSVTIPDGVREIGDYAFLNCSMLSSVILPESIDSIGKQAFTGTRIKTVNIPEGATAVAETAFWGCSGLTEIIGWRVGIPTSSDLVRVVVSGNVETIPNTAFGSCSRLISVEISPGVRVVGKGAFWECTSLKEVSFPEGLEEIGINAFYGCSALESVVIPPSVTTILQNAFARCSGLQTVRVEDGETERVKALLQNAGLNVSLLTFIEPRPTPPQILPAGKVVVAESQTVSMKSEYDGGRIYYTVDGSEPTELSPLYSGKFRLQGRCTVRAIVVVDGVKSRETTAEYAFGRCETPVIKSANGTRFLHANNLVEILGSDEEGAIHFTTDGSEPTRESPLYAGAFTISESTVVRAKSFSDVYFDSDTAVADLVREWEKVDTPMIVSPESFTGSSCAVSISVRTEKARVFYTLDGSAPSRLSTEYKGPFVVTGSCEVGAIAMCEDYLDSDVSTMSISKIWAPGDSLGIPDHPFGSAGATGWVDDGGTAVRSGNIGDGEESILTTVVAGCGVLSFEWKASCESDQYHAWDHAEFRVDGVVVAVLDGITDWISVTHRVKGLGDHEISWAYVKDDEESQGEDCVRMKGYSFVELTTPVVEIADGVAVVTLPDGVDPASQVVEVPSTVGSVVSNGAAIRVMNGDIDITEYLDIRSVGGVLQIAGVKPEVLSGVLDPKNGSVVELNPTAPRIEIGKTMVGLRYKMKEGTSLSQMLVDEGGDEIVGNGSRWVPVLRVRGGKNAFYAVEVTK